MERLGCFVVETALTVTDCRVTFGPLVAVNNVSLAVAAGELVTLLGPNGAGKTTLVETLLGFRRPSGGTVRVGDFDPVTHHRDVVTSTGALLQRGGVWFPMTPAQVLALTATYYDAPRRPDELLAQLDLRGCANTPWRRLSGGEQQRTLLALALLGRPRVLVLDEPTAAVDPEGRQVVRQILRDACADGVAVLVTTHELPEAERLADRVAIMHHGSLVAEGTVSELAGPDDIVATVTGTVDAARLTRELGVVVSFRNGEVRCPAGGEVDRVGRLTALLAEQGVAVTALRTKASLEERYLAIIAAQRGAS